MNDCTYSFLCRLDHVNVLKVVKSLRGMIFLYVMKRYLFNTKKSFPVLNRLPGKILCSHTRFVDLFSVALSVSFFFQMVVSLLTRINSNQVKFKCITIVK